MRSAAINRKTAETDIALTLNLDGTGESRIDSGVGFLDHMLTLFARHGRFDLPIPTEKVGSFDTELVEEFFTAFCMNAGITLHIKELAGKNSHHIIEGCFKSFARSLRKAVAIDPVCADELPSTKGVLG